jgi:hypothetical protein
MPYSARTTTCACSRDQVQLCHSDSNLRYPSLCASKTRKVELARLLVRAVHLQGRSWPRVDYQIRCVPPDTSTSPQGFPENGVGHLGRWKPAIGPTKVSRSNFACRPTEGLEHRQLAFTAAAYEPTSVPVPGVVFVVGAPNVAGFVVKVVGDKEVPQAAKPRQ